MAKLFEAFTDPSKDPGRWFPVERELRPGEEYDPADSKNKDAVAFLVRSIPEDVDEGINRSYFGNKVRYQWFKGKQVLVVDRHKGPALQADKACYAFLDSKNAAIQAGDEGFAKQLSEAVGREVKVGELVCVDGHWNDVLKKYLFKRSTRALQRVLDAAGVLELEIRDDEEGKDEG